LVIRPNQQHHSTEGQWLVNQVNPTKFSSLKGKEKDISKNIYYIYSTMKTEDKEALGRQSYTKQDQSRIQFTVDRPVRTARTYVHCYK